MRVRVTLFHFFHIFLLHLHLLTFSYPLHLPSTSHRFLDTTTTKISLFNFNPKLFLSFHDPNQNASFSHFLQFLPINATSDESTGSTWNLEIFRANQVEDNYGMFLKNAVGLEVEFCVVISNLGSGVLDVQMPCVGDKQLSVVNLQIEGRSEEVYTIRDKSNVVCLTAVLESSLNVSNEEVSEVEVAVERCFDKLNVFCNSFEEFEAGDDVTEDASCEEIRNSQMFFIEGINDDLPTRSPTASGRTPSPKNYQPFSDRFERIYQSLIILIFVTIICLFIYRYDAVPDWVRDRIPGKFGRSYAEKNILESYKADIDKAKAEKAQRDLEAKINVNTTDNLVNKENTL